VQSYCSFARPGSFDASVITTEALENALVRVRNAKQPHISDVQRIFNSDGFEHAEHAAAMFYDIYMTDNNAFGKLPALTTQGCKIKASQADFHTYQTVKGSKYEDGTPSMRAIWPGYTRNTFSPAKSRNNDTSCIAGRVLEPRNSENPNTLLPHIVDFRIEFLTFLVPQSSMHTLAPEDQEYMELKFNKPSQRSLIDKIRNFMEYSSYKIRSFQKAEAYPKVTSPRNITTLPMEHNLALGKFMYPFMCEILKKTDWYAFGKHPLEMSQLLSAKTNGKSYAITTDANKMDGSLSGFFRDLLVDAFNRAFSPRYHSEVRRLESKERFLRSTTAHGVFYDTGNSILSGSIITSVLGSLTNAFINYVALRKVHNTALDAWTAMGMYGGDDGVTFDLKPEILKQTAAEFGMAFDAEEIPAGQPVPFLGRIYPDLWTSNQSMCDVLRIARKLHLTASPLTTPNDMVLHRKACGLMVTDYQTPFIGKWAAAVMRILSYIDVDNRLYATTFNDQIYWAKYNQPFMQITDDTLGVSIVAKQLGLTAAELLALEVKFDAAKQMSDLYLTDIFHTELKVTEDAVVNGVVLVAKPRVKIPDIVKKTQSTIICKRVNCKVDKCPFKHLLSKIPVLQRDVACRFGVNCTKISCAFTHSRGVKPVLKRK
jgi:hypothetical protein